MGLWKNKVSNKLLNYKQYTKSFIQIEDDIN
jgi:hypothetical protein